MNFKKLFSTLTILILAAGLLSAYSGYYVDEGSRDPDSRKRRDDDYTGVIIKTNVDEAEVYINGSHFGDTPLATVELTGSSYSVEIRKPGYDTIRCRIHPRKHYTYTYIFVMQKTCGYIKIKNFPADGSLYIDGTRNSSNLVEVSPGSHTIKVRQFGYEDYSQQVYVENHQTAQVEIKLKPAPFRISQFKVSKSVINPDYTSSLGKVNISFEVTNDGSAMVLVNDRYGNTVWSRQYNSFSTWEQSTTWSGRGSDGERLPDGLYTVKLISFDNEFSAKVKIDRSLVYPITAVTPSGSGIGTMPMAFGSRVNYTKLFVQAGVGFNTALDNPLAVIPLNAGIVIDFARNFELAGALGTEISTDGLGASMTADVSFKGQAGMSLGGGLSLNFAGFTSYNLGKGLGLGASLGLDAGKAYAGITGQYVFGATAKDKYGNKAEDFLKYGAAISFIPVTNVRTSMWGAMYNDNLAEAGVEMITMPGSGGFCLEAKAYILKDVKNIEDKNMAINAQIGLSYLF